MAPTTTRRVKNISICVPFLYGNTATPLTLPKDPHIQADHTHSWTVFVRPVNGQDLTPFIKKVVFKLHDTYNNPTRSIESPPWEVTETGWGEFEINIKIYFMADAFEKNLSFYHHLKLHPYTQTNARNDGTVESISYDEIIFNEPTEPLFEKLTQKVLNYLPYDSANPTDFTRKVEEEEIERLDSTLQKVLEQISKQKNQLHTLEKERDMLTKA